MSASGEIRWPPLGRNRWPLTVDIAPDLPPRVIPIDAHLPAVRINRLGVHIWTTHGNDLRRMIKFRMEYKRVDAPIEWCRGNGVLGVAWERGRRVTADLSALYEEAEKMDPATFDALAGSTGGDARTTRSSRAPGISLDPPARRGGVPSGGERRMTS